MEDEAKEIKEVAAEEPAPEEPASLRETLEDLYA